ncbi:MAG: 4Fe-4S dicluster domain-containing protein [Deltaproteobacteria bacterium]|jgi:Fe-S oxidoreductase|nr:4Fe-4S dicluster domain-containing protein [Deltaproteobacteria bacterium]
MEQRTLEQFESLCTQESPPACQSHCPIQVEAGTVVTQAASGQTDLARKTLERHMPLAGLCGRLCEGPCREHCLREGLDSGVNVPLVELHVARMGRPPGKPFPLPPSGHGAALVGSGLSALVCAYCLAVKGHRAEIFHGGAIGGRLLDLPRERLPLRVLDEALGLLRGLKVGFVEAGPFGRAELAALMAEREATFLALDDPWLSGLDLGLAPWPALADPVTRGLGGEGLFLGPEGPAPRHIDSMSAGKKAAASMERLFQGVNPATAREREATGPSRLAVDLSGREPMPEEAPADPLAPTPGEAQAEARRCLSCSCLSCLPPCPLMRLRKSFPRKLAREFYNNVITAFGIRHSNRHINSCAECGLCGQICPNGADLGRFVALARLDMVRGGHMPVSAHEFALEDQEFSNSPEAAFLRPSPGGRETAFLLFPGCQLVASSPLAVLAAHAFLDRGLPGRVGLWAGCCGAPGRWSGRPGLTGRTAAAMRAAWEGAGRPKVILACPSCALFFAAELPEIPTAGLWPTMDGLGLPEGARALDVELIIHDPCSARLDEEGQEAVRSVMRRLGQGLAEPPMSRRLTLCCGYGGLASEANPGLGREYAMERTRGSPGPILAWCSVCRDRFRELGHGALHPLDLLFPRGDPADLLYLKPPGPSARRAGRAYFKRLALASVWGETAAEEEERTMGLRIDIPGSVLEDMESRRILVADVAAVLESAAAGGPVFLNRETGHRMASHRPRQVTFWVEYEERADGSLLVHRAWSHRMDVPGVQGEGRESPASLEGFARTGGRV